MASQKIFLLHIQKISFSSVGKGNVFSKLGTFMHMNVVPPSRGAQLYITICIVTTPTRSKYILTVKKTEIIFQVLMSLMFGYQIFCVIQMPSIVGLKFDLYNTK